jgi:hypothetical protein
MDPLNLDQFCRSAHLPWSVTAASPNNASFANLLAGFAIGAIAFLLARERRQDKVLHAVALFAPGVLVLALAGNQFVGISAIAAPAGSTSAKHVCSVAWTQAAPALGMLGVGFVVVVAGLAWGMMAHATEGTTETDAQDQRSLVHLGNFLVFVAIATVSLLLAQTALLYFGIMRDFGLNPPRHITGIVWSIFGCITALSAVIISRRTLGYYRVRWERMRWGDADQEEPAAARLRRRSLFIGVVVLTAGMALTGPLYGGLVGQTNSVPGNLAAFFAFALVMLLPYVVFLFISASVPGPDFWYWEGSPAPAQAHAAGAAQPASLVRAGAPGST